MKNLITWIILLGYSTSLIGQDLRNSVYIKTPIFEVWYNEVYEQPIKLIYKSTNRTKNVDRGSMDFKTEKLYHTSDKADYYKNIYDKGHLAPAATFSDNIENLKQTFSYLNCALQNQYMNRVEWRMLESKERIFFTKDLTYKCFDFKNIKPTKSWEDHEVIHKH